MIVLLSLVALAISCPFAGLGQKLSPEVMERLHASVKNAAALEKRAEPAKRATKVPIEQTFVLTSRVKTPASQVYNQGFPVGFAVNNFETPELDLFVGKYYNFTVISGCIHPFYLSFDARGRGRSPVTDGFVDAFGAKAAAPTNATNGNPICGGKSIIWTPPVSTVGQLVTYQCFVHDNMGWIVNVKNESLCDKYTGILKSMVSNNAGLLNALVGAVLNNVTSASSPIIDYFDGAVPTGSTDFTAAASAPQVAALQSALVSFFGDALGCSDGSIAHYTGPSMKQVHANIPIDGATYDAFVSAIAFHAGNFGVTAEDIATIGALLNSNAVRGQVCNFAFDCSPSLCNKYSSGTVDNNIKTGENLKLMTAVVGAVVTAEVSDPLIKPFFDGTVPPGSTNFLATANAAQLTRLENDLIAFFGGPAALSCTDPTFPNTSISVQDLKQIHQFMPINTTVFNRFNDIFASVLKNLSVSTDDIAAIRAVLDSTEPLICNQPGCSQYPIGGAGANNTNTTTTQPTNTVQHIVGIAAKTAAINPDWFGKGFASNFLLDGSFQQGINVNVGTTYVFNSNVSCFHPFYLTSGFGAGSTEITDGVSQGVGINTCSTGSPLIWTPTAAQVGATIYYQCRNHEYMGGRICVNAAGTTSPANCTIAGVTAAVDPSTLTPCDDLVYNVQQKNKTAFPTASSIIQTVVVDTFLVAVGSPTPLTSFFDGTGTDPGRDFVHNLTLQGDLVAGLVKFFGGALGCSDNSIDLTYTTSDPAPNLKTIHQSMSINQSQFDLFNSVLAGKLTNFHGLGVGMTASNAKKAYTFLNATSPDVCAGCGDYHAPTLCEKWATESKTYNGDQVKMMTDVVVGVFTALVGNSTTKPFFDGTVPCASRDFVDNAVIRGALVTQLVAFFGSAGVLGCTQSGFPQYTGNTDMGVVHQYMPITQAIFDSFVNTLVQVVMGALSADVPSLTADLGAVGALLYSPGVYVICNQADCTATGNGQLAFMSKPAAFCPVPPPPAIHTTKATTGTTATTVAGGTPTTVGVTTTPAGTTTPTTVAGTGSTTAAATPTTSVAGVTGGAASIAIGALVAVLAVVLAM